MYELICHTISVPSMISVNLMPRTQDMVYFRPPIFSVKYILIFSFMLQIRITRSQVVSANTETVLCRSVKVNGWWI